MFGTFFFKGYRTTFSEDSIISHIKVGTTTAFKTQVDAIIYSLIVGEQCTQNLLSKNQGISRSVGKT